MLKSLIAASDGFMIFVFVLDALLILGAIGLFILYYLKTATKNKKDAQPTQRDENIEKINDDTYVIATDEVQQEPVEVAQKDNAVEHFVNQISDINEQANNELTENTIVVKHEVEQPVKKLPRKDEIQNYVMIDGVKKEKTESERLASHNRGSDAFKNSTNFLNLIKEEQVEYSSPEKKKTTTSTKKTSK